MDRASQNYPRLPRLQVLMNGKPLPGALSVRWNATSSFEPDSFTATFALNADARTNFPWWDKIEVPAEFDLQAGLADQQNNVAHWFSLGIGQADDAAFDPSAGTVTLTGRDLSARLVEAKTAESFQNQKSSEIVKTLAARHGLTPQITAASTDLQTRIFTHDYTHETAAAHNRSTNEWDLLVRLAQQEGMDLFVAGRTLYYQPLPTLADNPYVLTWEPATATAASPASSGIDVRMQHKLLLAKAVKVVVQSFHSRHGSSIKAVAVSGGKGKPQVYNFVRPNLTPSQAQTLANNLLLDVTRHQRTVSWRAPGYLGLTPRSVVRIDGSGTGFDQGYYVQSISTRLDFEGYEMDVRVKNVSKAVQAAKTDVG